MKKLGFEAGFYFGDYFEDFCVFLDESGSSIGGVFAGFKNYFQPVEAFIGFFYYYTDFCVFLVPGAAPAKGPEIGAYRGGGFTQLIYNYIRRSSLGQPVAKFYYRNSKRLGSLPEGFIKCLIAHRFHVFIPLMVKDDLAPRLTQGQAISVKFLRLYKMQIQPTIICKLPMILV